MTKPSKISLLMGKRRIVCFGPGPQFKGGLANYNTALAKALAAEPDTEVHIVSWTQQYPALIPRDFVDKSSKTNFLEDTDIQIQYLTNYNNPLSWRATYQYIVALQPDLVVFQWAIALQGIPLGWIARKLRRHAGIEVVFDLHFVEQKEGSVLDRRLTKRGIRFADTYIVHAMKTYHELQALFPGKPFFLTETGARSTDTAPTVLKLYHPLYDLFSPDPDFDVAGFKLHHGLREHVFLFFGFIRKYKGLHHAIRAFKKVADQRADVSLLICGESFWHTLDAAKWSTKIKQALFGAAKAIFLKNREDERNYRPLDLIKTLDLSDRVMVVNTFIPNEEVHQYFQVSDAVVLYYEYATPSGIESLSYNFKCPILATNVGHFPETIEDGFNGYIAQAGDLDSMAEQMLRFLDHPLPPEHVVAKTQALSWARYAQTILGKNMG